MKFRFALFLRFAVALHAADVEIVTAKMDGKSGPGREHMLGNQSQNSGLQAVPAPKKVVIDGKLDEWDLSGRMASFAEISMRDQYSVETAAMWDKDTLYIGLHWRDKTPMFNMIDPEFDETDGWKGDALQMRVVTDQVLWINAWYFTEKKQGALLRSVWKNSESHRDGLDHALFVGQPGATDLGEGVQMACAPAEGGYVQEICIPWKLLYRNPPAIAAGHKLRIGFEYLWGDPTGKTFPDHRYTDNMQPGETLRLFFWQTKKVWGDVTLAPKGNLPLRQYQPQDSQLAGPVLIRLAIPEKAKRVTVVIDDAEGRRVRNLAADLDPASLAASEKDGNHQIEIRWDGRDDNGKPVAEGAYRVRGLSHSGIMPVFDTIYYNPGNPPWDTADGKGAWGADHDAPSLVERAGDMTILGWHFAEGGSGIVGVGPDGRKAWGDKRGALVLAADGKYVYAIINTWGRAGQLCRFDARTGAYEPFVSDGKELPFEVSLSSVIPDFEEKINDFRKASAERESSVIDMASDGSRLFFSLSGNRLALADAATLKHLKSHRINGLGPIATAPDGKLYGLINGRLHEITPDTGVTHAIPTPGLVQAGDLSVGPDGSIAIMDLGLDQQAKVFTPAGEPVAELGKKGGRPYFGPFEPSAMSHVRSIAYDAVGNLWAVEHWDYPRRVSVWGRDGGLVRDYIGNTGYSGVGGHLHYDDPSIAYVGPVEMKLDRANDSYKVTEVIWVPDPARSDEPPRFAIPVDSYLIAQRFRSKAGGVEREFLFQQPHYNRGWPSVLFMKDDNGWRPVAAIGHVGHLSGRMDKPGEKILEEPSGAFTGLHARDGVFWNDENEDGRVQRAECVIIPATGKDLWGQPSPNLPFGSGWNNTMNPEDLSFLTSKIYRYKPLRFTKKGAPVYGPGSITRVVNTEALGTMAPYEIFKEKILIGMQAEHANGKRPNFVAFDGGTGKELWSYPNDYPGVHATHHAPMARPGFVIGPLKIVGQALVDDLGTVFAIRGNYGQDFYFTADGLYIGAVFLDGRFPAANLPSSLAEIKGRTMEDFSEGGEPFSGWFGRQGDGKFRMTTSIARQAVLISEITGLETIRRFTGPEVKIDASAHKAILAFTPPKQDEGSPKALTIAKVGAPLTANSDKGWEAIPATAVTRQGALDRADVRLGYDTNHLYAAFDVADTSPMKNEGRDFKRLFKTGDAVDLQIGPAEPADRKDPGANDTRVLLSFLRDKPAAVLMRPVDAQAVPALKHTYHSPVAEKAFARVEARVDIQTAAVKTNAGYVYRAVIPWSVLGLKPVPGTRFRGDVGFISSDAAGTVNIARTYWANKATGLVNDEPQESWLNPSYWGTFTLGE